MKPAPATGQETADRTNPEHWDRVADLATSASKEAHDRADRRYWKKTAKAAKRQAALLRLPAPQ